MSNATKLGSKTDLWMMSATDLVIVGLDTEDGPEHELYRVDVREPIDATLVPSIRKHGVLTPIRARRSKTDPTKADVVMGRSRVRAVRAIVEDGGDPIKIPVMLWPAGSTTAEIIGAANAENHVRKTESVLTTMEHVWLQLRAEGGPEVKGAIKSVATDLGIGEGKVRGLLKLRACPDVVELVRSGAITETAAIALASLPDAARAQELMDMETSPSTAPKASVAETRKRVQRARAVAKGKAKDEASVATTLDMRTLKGLAAMDDSGLTPEVVAFLHVVVGAKAPDTVPGLVAALRRLGIIRD